MSAAWGVRELSAATVLAAAVLLVSAPEPVSGQTGVEIRNGAKAAADDPETALARLLDGWGEASRDAGEAAKPVAVAEALVAMMQQPIKGLELERLDLEGRRALKGAVTLAEERVRAVAAALSRGETDEATARTTVQRAVDEYLSVLDPLLEAGAGRSAGADRH